jgi:histidinol-phosphate aminotransferase
VPATKAHLAGLYRTNPHAHSRRGYLRLDMNEGVPGLPEEFVQHVLSQVHRDYLAAYPEYQTLQGKIAAHNRVLPENIVLSNGSDAAIKYIFDAYVSPGDRVLLTDPTFAMYPVYCRMFHAQPVTVGYRADFSFPWEEFWEQLAPGLRLAVIVNPNNPTGTALSAAQVLALAGQAAKSDILFLVDEAYFYFYPETVIREVANLPNLIVLRTFSKLCGMATARLGYAAACPEVAVNLENVRPSFDINGFAVRFGEAVLDTPDLLPGLVRDLKTGKAFLADKLVDKAIPHRVGQANFILIKCEGRVAAVMEGLKESGILVSGGFNNPILRDYIRVTVGRRNVMKLFWEAFIPIWEKN